MRILSTSGVVDCGRGHDDQVCKLRTLIRQRENLIQYGSAHIQHMQKAMTQMNIQLHKVISDISGVTGLKIMRAILDGERDKYKLADMRHNGIKSSREQIAKALEGDYREEHLFCLKQALTLFDVYKREIEKCDNEIENNLNKFDHRVDSGKSLEKTGNSHSKNKPNFDLRTHLFQISGVDLTKIDGIDVLTSLTIISEWGLDMSKFPTEKHISSWLGLCPDNRISGDKVLKRKTKKVINRSARALRLAAQSLIKSKSALGAYHRKMRARLGTPKAITATAHKLCKIVYRLLKYGEEYVDRGQNYYEEKYKERVIKNLEKRAKDYGFSLVPGATENPAIISS